ncbi:MAG: ATP-binding cassette domain-containing protein [Halothece sp.]
MQKLSSTPKPQTKETTVISVEGLTKQYGNFTAVKAINFTVTKGEIFGLIGPDGAGKTTTFNILAGVMEASSGKVEVLGNLPQAVRLQTGYLTQKFSLYSDLSIDENIAYNARVRRVPESKYQPRAQELLQRIGLEEFRNRLAGQLSGGMKQKLALCCALVSNPEVLFLDEPTTGVDPVSRREFWDLLASVAAEGVTIIAATPYLDEAERCHRIALIYEGEIQQIGTVSQLRESIGLVRLEVRCDEVLQAETVLREETQLSDVQSFGDRVDVLTSDSETGKQVIQECLSQNNITLKTIETNEPTLENVFVSNLRASQSDPPFIPFPRYRQGKTDADIAIGAYNLQKTFGDFQAVKGIDVEVKYGEIYGLLGANGAGKTTTIKMLCGLLPASGGDMILAGQRENIYSSETRSRIGYMSQKFTLYDDLTIIQNLRFYCGVYGVPKKLRSEKINWVLKICGLEGQENTLTARLPGGWKQRVAFGASVMHEPEILFLDEPTSGVDPLARRQFWRFIRDFAQNGTAILVTTHYLEEAENCNRMGFMVAGEVVTQGSPTEIKSEQPGQLVEIKTDDVEVTSNSLKAIFESWRVAIFGDRVHLVLDNYEQQWSQVKQCLEQENLEIYSHRLIPFSLEDAFIGIVQRETKNNS